MTKNLRLISGLDHSVYVQGSKSPIYLYLELEAIKAANTQKRLPLNLGIVIDRSGSMSGEKIEYARKAVKFIIQNLNSEDTISIVQYDDRVNVLYPAGPVKDKEKLIKLVDTIQERGTTNLSGGMMEGFNQVVQNKKDGQVNRVLLLSDGLANRGVTDPSKIAQMAQNAYREQGISLSSFGIGADFNENLMSQLAEVAGGQQYFIGLAEDIPNIFASELQDLLAVVAQNVQVDLSFPSKYLKLEKQFGLKAQVVGDQIKVNYQDIFSEDRKAHLFKFSVKSSLDQEINFKLQASFDDVLTEMKRINFSHIEKLFLTQSGGAIEGSANRKVLEQIAILESNTQHEELIRLVENRKYDQAKMMAKQLITYIEGQLLHFPDSLELKEQLISTQTLFKEIDEYENMSAHEQSLSAKHYKSESMYLRGKKGSMLRSRRQMRFREKGNNSNS